MRIQTSSCVVRSFRFGARGTSFCLSGASAVVLERDKAVRSFGPEV